MRAIDADALLTELNRTRFPGAPYVDAGISIAIGKVCDAPTIEPRRKTGKWLPIIESDEFGKPYQAGVCCNVCGFPSCSVDNYCPNCGAAMTEGEQDD